MLLWPNYALVLRVLNLRNRIASALRLLGLSWLLRRLLLTSSELHLSHLLLLNNGLMLECVLSPQSLLLRRQVAVLVRLGIP